MQRIKNSKKVRIASIAVIVVTAALGSYFIVSSHAATPFASQEAESGTLAGEAAVQADSNASGSSSVRFGTAFSSESDITGSPAGITPGSVFEGDFNAMSTSDQQAVVTQMKAVGVSWLRLDVTSSFSSDTFIKDAVAQGIHIDAILQGGSNPATMGTFSTEAVNHLKPLGVTTYEVLNEPNCNSVTAADYTAVLQASYTAIKAADPTAFVLMAGLCPESGSNEPYTYLTAMYADGVHGYFDAANMHPYSYPDTPLQTSDTWNPWSYLAQLHAIMAANGDGSKQIWLTEFGCPTGSDGGYPDSCNDSTLAAQITDAFASARSQSWLGPLFIYNWRDDNTAADGDFGLYTADNVAKPETLAAYEAAANAN
jgi:hypothetical protein